MAEADGDILRTARHQVNSFAVDNVNAPKISFVLETQKLARVAHATSVHTSFAFRVLPQ